MRTGCGAMLLALTVCLAAMVTFVGCQSDRPAPADHRGPVAETPTTLTHDHTPPPRTPEN